MAIMNRFPWKRTINALEIIPVEIKVAKGVVTRTMLRFANLVRPNYYLVITMFFFLSYK